MNEVTRLERPSLIQTMARAVSMEPEKFAQTIKATCIKGGCSNEDFAAFLMVAHQHGLNPVTREVYAFPRKGGGIQPIVSIDGWMKLINNHPNCDGMDFEDHFEDGKLTAITCKIYRKDRSRPVSITEYMAECVRPTEPWQKWPARMLRHKAAIQCARYAFSFSGIIDQDEADRSPDVITDRVTAPPPPPIAPPDQGEPTSGIEAGDVLIQAEDAFDAAETVDGLESVWGDFEHLQEQLPEDDASTLIGLYEARKAQLTPQQEAAE